MSRGRDVFLCPADGTSFCVPRTGRLSVSRGRDLSCVPLRDGLPVPWTGCRTAGAPAETATYHRANHRCGGSPLKPTLRAANRPGIPPRRTLRRSLPRRPRAEPRSKTTGFPRSRPFDDSRSIPIRSQTVKEQAGRAEWAVRPLGRPGSIRKAGRVCEPPGLQNRVVPRDSSDHFDRYTWKSPEMPRAASGGHPAPRLLRCPDPEERRTSSS